MKDVHFDQVSLWHIRNFLNLEHARPKKTLQKSYVYTWRIRWESEKKRRVERVREKKTRRERCIGDRTQRTQGQIEETMKSTRATPGRENFEKKVWLLASKRTLPMILGLERARSWFGRRGARTEETWSNEGDEDRQRTRKQLRKILTIGRSAGMHGKTMWEIPGRTAAFEILDQNITDYKYINLSNTCPIYKYIYTHVYIYI